VSERNVLLKRLRMQTGDWRMENAGNMRIEMGDFGQFEKNSKVCLK
jgi:hypothetical protein